MNNQSLLAVYGYLTGAVCAMFANANPSNAVEWTLWIAAVASSVAMTIAVWACAQLDVTNRMNEDHFRQLHTVISFDYIIRVLEKEERYEDAAKLKEAKEQLERQ